LAPPMALKIRKEYHHISDKYSFHLLY